MFSVEAGGFHVLYSRAAGGEPERWQHLAPPAPSPRVQGCSTGESAREGEQSLGDALTARGQQWDGRREGQVDFV